MGANVEADALQAWSCAANCWALMAVVFSTGHNLTVAVGVFGALVAERYGRNALRNAVIAVSGEIKFALELSQPFRTRPGRASESSC